MGLSVGDILLNLRLNTNTFSTDLNQVAKSAQKSVNTSFSGIGKFVTKALSVAAVTSFGKSCLDLGSDLQEVQNVVDVTFPNMANKVNDFAKSAINSYGLSETVAKKMVGTFGSMAKAFNFSESAAYDMATELTGLAGDVASFYNLDPSEAYTKMKSVFSGETEALKDLGVVMTQNALDQYALANGYGKTTAKMSEQEKVALRMAFVTEQLSAASGDFARTSDSWANKIKVLSLNFDSLKATLGQGLINVLSPIVTWLNLIVLKLIEASKWFVAFTSLFTKKKTGDSTSQISKNLNNSSKGAKNLAKNMNQVGSNAKKAAKEIGALASFDEINNIGSTSTTSGDGIDSSISDISDINLSTVNDQLNETNELAEKIKAKWNEFVEKYSTGGKVIVAITAGIVAGLATIGTFVGIAKLSIVFGKVTSAVTTFFAAIKNFGAIKVILTAIGSALGGVTWPVVAIAAGVAAVTAAIVYLYSTSERFRTFIHEVYNSLIVPIATFLKDVVVSVISGVINIITSLWKNVLVPLGKFIGDVFMIAIEGIIEVWDAWKPSIDAAFIALNDFWNNVLVPLGEFIVNTFNKKFESWGNLINEIVPSAKNIFVGFKDFFVGIFTGDINKAIDGLLLMFDGFVDSVDKLFGTNFTDIFRGIVKFVKSVFTGDWKAAWEGVKQVFKGIVSTLGGIFKEPLNFIIKGINKFIDGLNKIKIPDWVPGVGGLNLNISKIPLLAEGGYVKANSPRLAVIGDNKTQGEIVSPENKMYDVMMSALKSYGGNMTQSDMSVILDAIYQVIEAIKGLRLVVDGDALNDDQNTRNEERALRTGRLIYEN